MGEGDSGNKKESGRQRHVYGQRKGMYVILLN
jgi:hypothetical protein